MKFREKQKISTRASFSKIFDLFVFLQHGSTLEATVLFSNYKPSPIPSGGLGIILKARFEIVDEKRQYLVRQHDLSKKFMIIIKCVLLKIL